MKHLFSESAHWKTTSAFVDSEGRVSEGIGESVITIGKDKITNQSWAMAGEQKLENDYVIIPHSSTRYEFRSENPALGVQEGFFDLNGNLVYSKFRIIDTDLNGFEVIRREGDICHATGALYSGNELINTWTARMEKS